MKLIEDLDRREIGNSGNKVRFALFECEFCKNQIIKQTLPLLISEPKIINYITGDGEI